MVIEKSLGFVLSFVNDRKYREIFFFFFFRRATSPNLQQRGGSFYQGSEISVEQPKEKTTWLPVKVCINPACHIAAWIKA